MDSRRAAENKKRRLKRLQRKTGPGCSGGESLSFELPGIEKMSLVLEAFVKPYLAGLSDISEIRAIYVPGAAAWNAALLPEDQQQDSIEDMIQKMGRINREPQDQARAFLTNMIDRKQAQFAGNRRMVLSFDLRDNGSGYDLNVISSLPMPQSP
jgi:hypothetical protein